MTDPHTTDQLERTRPCRIGWCDSSCRWETHPQFRVSRLHERTIDGYSIRLMESAHDGLDDEGATFWFPRAMSEYAPIGGIRAHLSTLRNLLSLVERDERARGEQ